jgi:hypothetical protein
MTKETKQTAVEWLAEQLNRVFSNTTDASNHNYKELLEQAKEMENNQRSIEISITKNNFGLLLDNRKINNLEWVFQFNNDTPIIILEDIEGKREINFTIGDTTESNIVFIDGKGNTFKIFAREQTL